MNAQEIFDTAAIGVIRQGKPSLSNMGNCAYRGKDGTKCAAGFLLSDEVYDPSMDCSSDDGDSTDWEATVKRFRSRLPDHLIEHHDLIKNLQTAHDTADYSCQPAFIRTFRSALHHIAVSHDLSMDNVNKVAKELGYA